MTPCHYSKKKICFKKYFTSNTNRNVNDNLLSVYPIHIAFDKTNMDKIFIKLSVYGESFFRYLGHKNTFTLSVLYPFDTPYHRAI